MYVISMTEIYINLTKECNGYGTSGMVDIATFGKSPTRRKGGGFIFFGEGG
jgi:hypothetical protein